MKKKRGKPVITKAPTEANEGMSDLDRIKATQKQIIVAIESGDRLLQKQLTDQLADLRAEVARKIEIEALTTELENRDLQRKRAEKISAKCVA